MRRILIIEDDIDHRAGLQNFLEDALHQVDVASSVNEAAETYALPSFDLIISDIHLPNQPGTDIIKLAQGVPVLVTTGQASLRSAVDAMKLGAADYLAKPFDHKDLIDIVNSILKQTPSPILASATSNEDDDADKQIGQLIFGQCQAMKKVFHLMKKVAPTEATVLIQGETGSGKELAARAIHKLSNRRNHEYICINCAAIPESLIESELFGHEKGAFTGAVSARNGLIEAADGGTLFLDEIGELPLEAQARLLRVLQEGEIRRVGSTQSRQVNVRLIAATHRNLKALSRTGQFREDLFYRLNVVQLKLPPLRERGDDILGLANTLLAKASDKLGQANIKFSPDAMKAVQEYHWPGNVRELEHAIERGTILCDNKMITAELLDIESEVDDINIPKGLITPQVNSPYSAASQLPSAEKSSASSSKSLSIEDYFQQFVLENQDHMNETELAKRLGISRKNLWERRQRLGIPRKKSN
ncbi:Fis family transcriptional regulator [Oleiphilus sp. HI0068]|uniref:sigma-54-dependent transcriptional regulator n=2 Tax=unclassified Oleiphilus TaxID=2631174 RepID=UPI0007CF7BC9|nr:sigma-54 dependent transcriptional regulator [Oleiphilus sp. HI0061]KZY59873.1 Fis family transcriptional regulator [Oleiphilus sp. HI0061]KZY77293.1 Fis family transcriptional regulator [Oleiphilus sp. HI0068]KZY83290.1 Fis family transcriptional regulator [Oleiphilus sp. HI0069]